MNLQTAFAGEDSKVEEIKRNAGRLRAVAEQNGKLGHTPLTPQQYFESKYPGLSEEHGHAVLEDTDKHGIISVKGINEDFFAAMLGPKGSPEAPTVFLPAEQKFFKYSPGEGIYKHQRDAALIAEISQALLACARAVKTDVCKTESLEFGLRDSTELLGVLRKAKGHLQVDSDFFKTDLTKYIACANGMYSVGDNTLEPFAPTWHRRNKLAVRFDPAAKCPMFLNVLMAPALEPDDIEMVQRWCGAALIGENVIQKILILIGLAGTGKTCFIKVLGGIIGQANLALLRPQLLCERFEISRYLDKTLLYGPDVSGDFLQHRGAAVLKSLTGYDPMTVEFKNSNETPSVIGNYNVIVTCNSRLAVHLDGDTDAWRRRLVIVDYHKAKPEKVIADLDQQILANEGSGVLNWMLEGLAKLRTDGWQLHLTREQQTAVDNLLLESDGHSLFVKNELVKSENSQLTVHDCFAGYAEYCTERGWTTLSRNRFGQVIGDIVTRQFGLTVRHDIPDTNGKAQRGWRGLCLRGKTTPLTSETATFEDFEIDLNEAAYV